MNADRIIVLGNGEILEQGSHDNLIAKGGKYADLWSKQVFLRPKDSCETDVGASETTIAGSAGTTASMTSSSEDKQLEKEPELAELTDNANQKQEVVA
jgi:ABC-type multidrug transport system ATPase subunit